MTDRDDQPPTRPTRPRVVPGVPGLPLPPRGGDEPTKPDVPLARRAAPRPTLKGLPAPPASEATLRSAPELEDTPPSGQVPPPLHGRIPPRQQTQAGLGDREPERQPQRQPASVTATLKDFPPRSVSPNPESVAGRVTVGEVEVPIKKRHLRALWVWVAPFVLTIATSAYGYVKAYAVGFAKGYQDAADRMAAVEGKVSSLASSVKKSTAETVGGKWVDKAEPAITLVDALRAELGG